MDGYVNRLHHARDPIALFADKQGLGFVVAIEQFNVKN
jgi:hypothetical protein